MKIFVHQAKKAEYENFLEFFRNTLGKHFPQYSKNSVSYTVEVDYSPKWLKKKLLKGGKKVFLAFSNKKIIGYLLVMKSVAGVSFGDWLAVEKDFRKKGIASKLLTFWEKTALNEGAHALQLWTTKNNLDFYKNRGFSKGGLFPKSWHGHDSYLIYKSLREPREENFLKEYLKEKK